MTAIEAIYNRRSVRDYFPQKVDNRIINSLLDAAVHAPTAKDEEPCVFVVIQDKGLLNRISDSAKKLLRQADISVLHTHATAADYNVFYNAESLIIICGKAVGSFVVSDCWLAAENIMLAACANGLGSCVIGFAVATLNTKQWKSELGIPEEMTVFAPIILGVPAVMPNPVPRKPPTVLSWL